MSGYKILNSALIFNRLSTCDPLNLLHHRNFRTCVKLQAIFEIKDEKDFKCRVLKSSKPVVVQFHASWCGPCKKLSPILEKVVKESHDLVDMARIDIDEHPEIALEYNVEAVPAVALLYHGKIIGKFIGLTDLKTVQAFIANAAKVLKLK